MIFKCIPTGMFESNCYIVGENGEGVIIDAGVRAEEVKAAVLEAGLKIKYIILTHRHCDHIVAVDELRDSLGARAAIHREDAGGLTNPRLNLSSLVGTPEVYKAAEVVLEDGDVLEAGGLKYEIIHTPGHSSGGICVKVGSLLFTGDTLFKNSVGRTDLGDGDQRKLLSSIQDKLLILDDSTEVYPGHGGATTIGAEKRNNPFLRD